MTCASANSRPLSRLRPGRRGRPVDAALHERRREQILCKASRVFAELGFQNADVQLVADPLGISKGTVYRYFPSKERLFIAAVERGVRQLDEHIQSAIARVPDPLEKITAATWAYLEFFERYPQLVELFIQERIVVRGRRKPVYFRIGHRRRASWRKLIRRLIDAGRIRNVRVERALSVLGDLVYGTMFANHLAGRHRPFEEQAEDILDVVYNGILTRPQRAAGNGSRNGRQHARGNGESQHR